MQFEKKKIRAILVTGTLIGSYPQQELIFRSLEINVGIRGLNLEFNMRCQKTISGVQNYTFF